MIASLAACGFSADGHECQAVSASACAASGVAFAGVVQLVVLISANA